MKDINLLPPPPMIEVSCLEAMDYIGVQIDSDILILPLSEKPVMNGTIKVRLHNGNEATFHWPHEWNALYLLVIRASTLRILGFVPASLNTAFDDTCDIWIKNETEHGRTWIATYDSSLNRWALELDEIDAGQSQPKRYDDNLIYLHHIQHCMRNPYRCMKIKQ